MQHHAIRTLAILLAATLLVAVGCSKSPTKPTPAAPLPNDPNTYAPPLSCVNHFGSDTTWVEVMPTTDDVEIQGIQLSFQYAQGGGWGSQPARLVGGSIVHRNTSGAIAVWGGHGIYPYAVTLWLDIRRTQYRTWFHVREE